MSRRWTEGEDRVLQSAYASGGFLEARKQLPQRTPTALKSRASEKGYASLQYGILSTWSDDDLTRLEETIQSTLSWAEVAEVFPTCTRCALRKRAKTEGISHAHFTRLNPLSKWGRWMAEEDRVLRQDYVVGGFSAVAGRLKRTEDAIRTRVAVLQLSAPRRLSARGTPSRMWDRVFRVYVKDADKRGYVWGLPYEDAVRLFQASCAYCGSPPLNLSKRQGQWEDLWYSGIDRVDNTSGYVQGNVLPCCKTCNYAKSSKSYDEWIGWIDRLVAFRSAQQQEATPEQHAKAVVLRPV